MEKPDPKLWSPWCFHCKKHVVKADWTPVQCMLRWSKKCTECGRRSSAPSVLFRNILLLPLCLLVGSYLSLWIKQQGTEFGLYPIADAIAPGLAALVTIVYVVPSCLGWIKYCKHVNV